MTQLTVLGTDGGIGDGRRTSCFLIDEDILIDAGTGLGDLPIDRMAAIDDVFLSHVHLDHIACLPLLLDTVIMTRKAPIRVHAPADDHHALANHIFNGVIWPDFTKIPTPDAPVLELVGGLTTTRDKGARQIGILPVDHHGEAVGYWVRGEDGTIALTGDTGPCPELWQAINDLPELRYMIIECSFPDELEDLALKTGHLCPRLLESELRQLDHAPTVLISHMKPAFVPMIVEELAAISSDLTVEVLERGRVLEF